MTQAARYVKLEESIHELESKVERLETEIKNLTTYYQQSQHNLGQRADLLQALVTQMMQKNATPQPALAPAPEPAAPTEPPVVVKEPSAVAPQKEEPPRHAVSEVPRRRGIA